MAIYETPNKITRIDKDTALYVLEKVQEAVNYTLNDNRTIKYGIDYSGSKVALGSREKTTQEMFDTLYDKLQNILNEIKGE